MSAPHIPSLATLRSARPRPFGRHARGSGPSDVDDGKATDRIVQQTDQDASVSRMSAVELGYLSDPFARDFVVDATQRRFPIINRGTYVRTTAIDTLVERFLAASPLEKKQIISLGAGSDTRYFRLRTQVPSAQVVYHELDFASNTAHKIAVIRRSPSLQAILEPGLTAKAGEQSAPHATISEDATSLYSSTYNIHPVDLRTLHTAPDDGTSSSSTTATTTTTTLRNVDPMLPTLILSECCLVYLPPQDADGIVKYFTSRVFAPSTPLGLIIYEPVKPGDSFGRVMVQNLASRGIVLQTLKKYSSLGRQTARLSALGFKSGQRAADVDFIWERWIAEGEKERVTRLEMLDEVEEWQMLAQHYCVAWGWRDGSGGADGDGRADLFRDWAEHVEGQSSDD
ncbi:MAG: carboxy methyl transferase for protein phosphatase 2A [Thelocarpon superellum]|nr:MAG: carboxy methyl transferase for protein phosphatase 2A [Thelocarpon superellum]